MCRGFLIRDIVSGGPPKVETKVVAKDTETKAAEAKELKLKNQR